MFLSECLVGKYDVTLSKEGYKKKIINLDVVEEQTLTISETLEKGSDRRTLIVNGVSDSDETHLPIYDVVEKKASFPNGDGALMQWLKNNITYPPLCQEEGISGIVVASFVVNTDGSISNIKIVRSPNELLSKETIRLISIMPKWIPASQGGKIVRSRYSIPIMFRLR